MKSTSKKNHWLDIAETSAVVGSIGGSLASIFLKQFLWVTIPLSVTVGLGVINHQRLKGLIATEQAAMNALIEKNYTKFTQLKEISEKQYQENKAQINELEEASNHSTLRLTQLDQATRELQTLQASMTQLEQLTQKLEQEQNKSSKLAQELKSIDKFSQIIKNHPNSAQTYFQRGSAYQMTGNIGQAIEDFSQAIDLRNDHAEAYHQRGLLYLEIDDPQKAIIDLRKASQYYIGKSDLDKYREARDLSLKIHFNQSTDANVNQAPQQPEEKLEPVAVNNLFA